MQTIITNCEFSGKAVAEKFGCAGRKEQEDRKSVV
jgi:hypothetical protein